MAADGSIIIDTQLDETGLKKGMDNLQNIISNGVKLAAGLLATINAGIIGTGIKFNAEIEQYQASFETMLGSAQKADELLGNLKNFAAKTPFELTDLTKASQVLLAFGEDANKLMPDLKMLGDISQGNKEKFAGLAVVFGQVQSQGKLMGNDMLQMINNGFNPLLIISQKTGRSMADLKDDMSKGAISFEMVADAMKIATSEGGLFFGAMEKQSHTLIGQWSTLVDNFKQTSGNLMKPLSDAITERILPALNDMFSRFDTKEMVKKITDITNSFINFASDAIPKTISGISGVAQKIGSIIEIMIKFKDILGGITAGFIALNIGMAIEKMIIGIKAYTTILAIQGATMEGNVAIQALSIIGMKAYAAITGVVAREITFQTAATGMATAAQTAFNIVMASNPIGAVVAGIALFVGAVTTLALVLNKTSDAQKELIIESDTIIQKSKELSESVEKTNKSYQDNISQISINAEANKNLASSIEELAAIKTRTAEQDALMNEEIKQLNDAVPNLSLAFDAETNSLNMSNEALIAKIDNYEKLMELQIIEQHLAEARAQQAEAEQTLIRIQNDRKSIQEALNKAIRDGGNESKQAASEINKLSDADRKYSEEEKIQQKIINDSTDKQKDLSNAIGKKTVEINKSNAAMEAQNNMEIDLNRQTKNAVDILKDYNIQHADLSKKIQDTNKSFESLSSAYQALSKGEKLSSGTISELIEKYPQLAKYISNSSDLSFNHGQIIKNVAEIEKSKSIAVLQSEAAELEGKIANAKASVESTRQEYISKTAIISSYYGSLETATLKASLAGGIALADYNNQKIALDGLNDALVKTKAEIMAVGSITVQADTATKSHTGSIEKNNKTVKEQGVSAQETKKAIDEVTNVINSQTEAAQKYTSENADALNKDIKNKEDAAKKETEIRELSDKKIAISHAKSNEDRIKAEKDYNDAVSKYALEAEKTRQTELASIKENTEEISKKKTEASNKAILDINAQTDASKQMNFSNINDLNDYIKENEISNAKRIQNQEITDKELAVMNAKTKDDKEKAEKILQDELNKISSDALKTRQKEMEDATEKERTRRIDVLKDIQYEEKTISNDITNKKIELFDKEYISKVKNIDASTAAFLENNNKEIQAIIDKISLTDKDAAASLNKIKNQKDIIQNASDAEKKSRKDELEAAREADLRQRIDTASTAENKQKAIDELLKYQSDKEYDARESKRQSDLKILNEQMAETLRIAKDTDEKSIEQANIIRKKGQDEIAKSIESQKIKIINLDLAGERKDQGESLKQLQDHSKDVKTETDILHTKLAEGEKVASDKNYTFVNEVNKNLIILLRSFEPKWYNSGKSWINQLTSGINAGIPSFTMALQGMETKVNIILSGIDETLKRLQSDMSNLGISQMISSAPTLQVPMHGTGGVFASPHLAIVGDFPEAIIPLTELNRVIRSAVIMAMPTPTISQPIQNASIKPIAYEQTINIYQPVQSPAQTARAISNASKEMARELN